MVKFSKLQNATLPQHEQKTKELFSIAFALGSQNAIPTTVKGTHRRLYCHQSPLTPTSLTAGITPYLKLKIIHRCNLVNLKFLSLAPFPKVVFQGEFQWDSIFFMFITFLNRSTPFIYILCIYCSFTLKKINLHDTFP